MNPGSAKQQSFPGFRRLTAGVWDLLYSRPRRQRAERMEERDWRRRIILASQRIQQVYLALGEDLGHVKGLRENLDRSTAGLERIESHVEKAEGLFGNIEERLGAHEQALQGGLERMESLGMVVPPPPPAASEEEVQRLHERIHELQNYARGRDEICHSLEQEIASLEEGARRAETALARTTLELDAMKSELEENARELFRQRDVSCRKKDEEISALTMQVEELRSERGESARAMEALRLECEETHALASRELTALLEAQQARAQELEERLAQREDRDNLEIAHLREEAEVLHRMSTARIEELEAQNLLLAAAPDSLAARHEHEIAALEEKARNHRAALEVQLRSLEVQAEEQRSKHAAELEALRAEGEWRIQLLEERAKTLEQGRADVEGTRAAAQRAAEQRLADLEEKLRDERSREQRIAELEAEVAHLAEVRAELDVVHVHEIARLKRTFREQMTALREAAEAAAASPPAPSSTESDASPAAVPSTEESEAYAQLERRLQEREAVLALLPGGASRARSLARRRSRRLRPRRGAGGGTDGSANAACRAAGRRLSLNPRAPSPRARNDAAGTAIPTAPSIDQAWARIRLISSVSTGTTSKASPTMP